MTDDERLKAHAKERLRKYWENKNRKPTNADRIRSMSDEDLALFLETTTEHGRVSEAEWRTWLKGEAQI